MQAKIGTGVSDNKLTFTSGKTLSLVSLDASFAAYSQEVPMSQWVQSWSHALTRLLHANFQDEMKDMCDLLRANFEHKYKEGHPELFVQDRQATPDDAIADGDKDEAGIDSVEEWLDLDKIFGTLREPPDEADAVGGEG